MKENNGERVYENEITSWIDGSQVYGSTLAVAKKLRTFKDGKLKSSAGGKFLPEENGLFLAGDERVNENIFLTSMHTLFMKEHNRKCDQILRDNPNMSD